MLKRAKEAMKRLVPPTTSMMDRRIARIEERMSALDRSINDVRAELLYVRNQNQHISEQLSALRAPACRGVLENRACEPLGDESSSVVVSFASYGKRIAHIVPMLTSLKAQTIQADRTFLWLPTEDFPHGMRDIPADVACALVDAQVTVRWAPENLGPHNKYQWTMRAFPNSVVITLDDDMVYPPEHLAHLLNAHRRWPDAVIAPRTNLPAFTEAGDLRPYEKWTLQQESMYDKPSLLLLATGVAGVLYPPFCLDKRAFDSVAIQATTLFADDLWLKAMELLKGTPVVCPAGYCPMNYIDAAQETALANDNLRSGKNDTYLSALDAYLGELGPLAKLMQSDSIDKNVT